MLVKRVAPGNAFRREPAALPYAVLADCLGGILRTRWVETTVVEWKKRRDE